MLLALLNQVDILYNEHYYQKFPHALRLQNL